MRVALLHTLIALVGLAGLGVLGTAFAQSLSHDGAGAAHASAEGASTARVSSASQASLGSVRHAMGAAASALGDLPTDFAQWVAREDPSALQIQAATKAYLKPEGGRGDHIRRGIRRSLEHPADLHQPKDFQSVLRSAERVENHLEQETGWRANPYFESAVVAEEAESTFPFMLEVLSAQKRSYERWGVDPDETNRTIAGLRALAGRDTLTLAQFQESVTNFAYVLDRVPGDTPFTMAPVNWFPWVSHGRDFVGYDELFDASRRHLVPAEVATTPLKHTVDEAWSMDPLFYLAHDTAHISNAEYVRDRWRSIVETHFDPLSERAPQLALELKEPLGNDVWENRTARLFDWVDGPDGPDRSWRDGPRLTAFGELADAHPDGLKLSPAAMAELDTWGREPPP